MIPTVDPNLQFYVIMAVFVVLAVFGLPVALRVWNDTRHGVDEESDSPEELITPLEEAFRSGKMTEAEYERVRGSVQRVVAPLLAGDRPKSREIEEHPESKEQDGDDVPPTSFPQSS